MIRFLNRDKEARARLAAGSGASDDKVLAEYVKLGGAYEMTEEPKVKRVRKPREAKSKK